VDVDRARPAEALRRQARDAIDAIPRQDEVAGAFAVIALTAVEHLVNVALLREQCGPGYALVALEDLRRLVHSSAAALERVAWRDGPRW
jgi:hypothetical protein